MGFLLREPGPGTYRKPQEDLGIFRNQEEFAGVDVIAGPVNSIRQAEQNQS